MESSRGERRGSFDIIATYEKNALLLLSDFYYSDMCPFIKSENVEIR